MDGIDVNDRLPTDMEFVLVDIGYRPYIHGILANYHESRGWQLEDGSPITVNIWYENRPRDGRIE